MNVQNPLAFMENYKAVKARLNPQAPARVTIPEAPANQQPRRLIPPAIAKMHKPVVGVVRAKPLIEPAPVMERPVAVRLYWRPIGPQQGPACTIYIRPIGPVQNKTIPLDTSDFDETIKPSFKRILREVCAKYQVSQVDILSRRRCPSITTPRHEVFYRLKNETTMSYPEMGRKMNGRDHTTAIASVRRYALLLTQGKVSL